MRSEAADHPVDHCRVFLISAESLKRFSKGGQMAVDKELIERVRKMLRQRNGVSEKRMFGGVAFMLDGNMCCGVTKELLVLRLGEEGVVAALKQPHTREMDFTGKPMKSMAFVDPLGTRADADLDAWIRRGVRFVRALPPKRMKKVRRD
jgi:TfoX/Sxy family transcriptional regulator of competence genes